MTVHTFDLMDLHPVSPDFFDYLTESTIVVARHVLAAWDGETVEVINDNLEAARSILRDVAGTAEKAGYRTLRAKAHSCEAQITTHLEGDYADLAICPGEILWLVDTFVETCYSMAA